MGEKISISSEDRPHHKPIRPLPDQVRSTESASSSSQQPWSSTPIYVSHPIHFHSQKWHKIQHNQLHVALGPLIINRPTKQPFRSTTRSGSQRQTLARSKSANRNRQYINNQAEKSNNNNTTTNSFKNASDEQKSNNLSIQFEIKLIDSSATKPNQFGKSNNITAIHSKHNPINITEITQQLSKSKHNTAASISGEHGNIKPTTKPNRIINKNVIVNSKHVKKQSDIIPAAIDAVKKQLNSNNITTTSIENKYKLGTKSIIGKPKSDNNSTQRKQNISPAVRVIQSKSNKLKADIQHQYLQDNSPINKPKSNNHTSIIKQNANVSELEHSKQQSNTFDKHNNNIKSTKLQPKPNAIRTASKQTNFIIKNGDANDATIKQHQQPKSKPTVKTNEKFTRTKFNGKNGIGIKTSTPVKITANTQNVKKISNIKYIKPKKQQHSSKFNSSKFNGRKEIVKTDKDRSNHTTKQRNNVNIITTQKNSTKLATNKNINSSASTFSKMMEIMGNSSLSKIDDNETMSVNKSKNHQPELSRSRSNNFDNTIVGNLLHTIGKYL